MTTILIISAVTNVVVVAQLLETRRRLRNAQRMFKMYARTRDREFIDNIKGWETR